MEIGEQEKVETMISTKRPAKTDAPVKAPSPAPVKTPA